VKQIVQSMRTGVVNVLDVPPPRLAGPGVLVQTAVSLISAGTERAALEFAKASLVEKARSRPDLVKQVLDKVRRDGLVRTATVALARLDTPVAPGYATAGTVLAVAPGVDDIVVGDRVACAGATYATHAEINYVPRNLMVPVPRRRTGEYVGFDEAAFTTVGAIALHAVRLGVPEIGQRVVVIGLGVIGLIATQILRAHGCHVFGIDLNPSRCDTSRALGADDAVGPMGAEAVVSRWSSGLGADLVIVAAATRGSDPAVLAAEIARERGRVVAVGATGLDLPRRTMYQKELSLVVSRSYGPGRYDPDYEERGHDYPRAYVRWTERENMRTFLALVADGRVDVHPLVSHRYTIERGAEAYDTLEQGDTLGILIDYGTAPAAKVADAITVPSRPRVHASGRPRISVIGAGAFARSVLLPSLTRAGASLGSVVAATGLSARLAADKFGFETCSTTVETIWRDSDAVVIATRHDSHAQFTIDALEAGKAVFVEKPLCITEAELQRIAHVVDTLRVAGQAPFVMVGFNRRFAPAVAVVREAMAGAPVSIVYRINAGRVAPQSWIARADEGGGRIVGEVCHFVDLCAHLAGSPVVEVCATRSAVGPDDVMVSLRMADGSLATVAYLIDGDRTAPKERIELSGGGRSATIDDFRRARVSGVGRTVRHGGVVARQDKGHAAEMAAFVSAVASGGVSPVSFESSINTTRATFAIVRSLESGGPVQVP
jgi:predicted dehydrogenase/threonine dehydrogenase-like Zn-dependent dehydrogenase